MSNTSPSDLVYSLFSGFPEDTVCPHSLLLLMKRLLRYSNFLSSFSEKNYLEVSFLNLYACILKNEAFPFNLELTPTYVDLTLLLFLG